MTWGSDTISQVWVDDGVYVICPVCHTHRPVVDVIIDEHLTEDNEQELKHPTINPSIHTKGKINWMQQTLERNINVHNKSKVELHQHNAAWKREKWTINHSEDLLYHNRKITLDLPHYRLMMEY